MTFRWNSLAWALVLLVQLSWPGWSQTSPADFARLDCLLLTIRERLELSRFVAETKWNNQLPIEDPVREGRLTQYLMSIPSQNLKDDFREQFILAQIAASKELQSALFDHWQESGRHPASGAPEIADLRTRLQRNSQQLLHLLDQLAPALDQPQIQQRLRDYPTGPLNTAVGPLRGRASEP